MLTPAEKELVPEGHTHRWTVAVRGAASTLDSDIVGGADDLGYFIKRVTFKLHETYANPSRSTFSPLFMLGAVDADGRTRRGQTAV